MTIQAFSPTIFGLSLSLHILLLAVKSSQYRRWIFFLFLASAVYIMGCTTTGVPTQDYMLDVQNQLHLVDETKPAHTLSFLGRIWWALQLMMSPRGIGWAHEVTAVTPSRDYRHTSSHTKFIARQLLTVVKCFFAADVALTFARRNPAFSTGGPSIAAEGWIHRSLNVLIYAIPTACQVYQIQCILSILAVGSGLSKPYNWPRTMVAPSNAYTIRRFWGRTWHQFLRRMTSSHGKWLAHSCLKLESGSNASYCLQLYVAFLMSGIIHAVPDYLVSRDLAQSGSMRFFLLQAVAITFEEAVIALAKIAGFKSEITRVKRYLGCLWVWMWFTYSLPPWVDWMLHAGQFEDNYKISVIEGVWRGDWTPSFRK